MAALGVGPISEVMHVPIFCNTSTIATVGLC